MARLTEEVKNSNNTTTYKVIVRASYIVKVIVSLLSAFGIIELMLPVSIISPEYTFGIFIFGDVEGLAFLFGSFLWFYELLTWALILPVLMFLKSKTAFSAGLVNFIVLNLIDAVFFVFVYTKFAGWNSIIGIIFNIVIVTISVLLLIKLQRKDSVTPDVDSVVNQL